jgi:hypothetical protein
MREAKNVIRWEQLLQGLIRREQLFVHFAYLRICVAHVANKTTNNNKYTEDTIQWELFHSDLL